MPPVHAPVASLIVGIDATVWIALRPTTSGQVALVFDGRGEPFMSVLVPLRSRIVQASADRVWMVETDADDLPSIVRYRVSRR